jgi:chromate transporter
MPPTGAGRRLRDPAARAISGAVPPKPSGIAGADAPSGGRIRFADACRYWALLGFVSFGGPAGQIALMHRDLVERRRWISEARFLHALNFCMLLPGPEAQQLAIYVGWVLHGIRGGVVAGILFVVPSAGILLGLSYVYAAYGALPMVAAAFYGLKPAVVALVVEALWRIGARVLRRRFAAALAAGAFVAISALGIPFPAIVAGAAAVGVAVERWCPALLGLDAPLLPTGDVPPAGRGLRGELARVGRVVGVCGLLWLMPVVLVGMWRGTGGVLFREAVLFSKAAMVTFGGAYAVLAYIRDMAVGYYGWLRPGQMLDGLGLAETTPGPLIMVTQFVGFVAAWNHPEGLAPLAAGMLGALVTTWVTFVPCFLWILVGAPFVERLRGNRRLGAALSAITSAVVGVIANLAVVFAAHTFGWTVGKIDIVAVALATGAFVALQRLQIEMPLVVAGCVVLGIAGRLLGG